MVQMLWFNAHFIRMYIKIMWRVCLIQTTIRHTHTCMYMHHKDVFRKTSACRCCLYILMFLLMTYKTYSTNKASLQRSIFSSFWHKRSTANCWGWFQLFYKNLRTIIITNKIWLRYIVYFNEMFAFVYFVASAIALKKKKHFSIRLRSLCCK